MDVKKSKLEDIPVLDRNGNVISDIHGEVYRDKQGYVILGKDGLIRDALGYIVKDAKFLPLKVKFDYAPTESKKSSLNKKRILGDEAVLNPNGTVDYDKYGVVKRGKNGRVVLGVDGIFRDSKGFALKDLDGFILKKHKNFKYNRIEDIDTALLPSKKSSTRASPKKVSIKNYTDDDKTVLNLLLNIKVPEGYYTEKNLKMKDLIDPARNLVPNFTKVFLSLYPSFFLSSSATTNIVINILALILSDAIPYPELKKKLTDEILLVLSSARKQASFVFANYILTNFKNNPGTVKILKSIPYIKIIPIILAGFTIYGGANKNLPDSLQAGISLFLADSSVPLLLNKKEVVTRSYLENEKIISPGDTTINLKKLGLFYKTSSIDNKEKGIAIEKILTFFSSGNLKIELVVYNPYTETKSVSATEIDIIKTDYALATEINKTTKRADRNIVKLNENIKYLEDLLQDINTIKKIRELNENKVAEEKFLKTQQDNKDVNASKGYYSEQAIAYREKSISAITNKINELTNVLKFSGSNTLCIDRYNTLLFSSKVLSILNFLKSRRLAVVSLLKDISKANKENINIIKIITNNTITEIDGRVSTINDILLKTNIAHVYNRIKDFDTSKLNIL